MLKTSGNGGWTIKQYETGIQTQEQEGTMIVAFKDGTQFQHSKGQLAHTYKVQTSLSRHVTSLALREGYKWQEVKDDKGEITVPATKWIMHSNGIVQEVITTEDGDTTV